MPFARLKDTFCAVKGCYTADGQWVKTEAEYGRSLQALPMAVQDGYAATSYARQQWVIDGIDEIQRQNYDTLYIIETEKAGQPGCALYFNLDGTLLREAQDDGGSHNDGLLPAGMPAEIQPFVRMGYAGAVVMGFDKDAYGYGADVRHDGKATEVPD